METLYSAFFVMYGLVIGSFLNVVIYRLPRKINISKGRSICPNCNTPIKAYDLIPVISYIILGGKCRYCKCKISYMYPLVEILTGFVFYMTYKTFGLNLMYLLVYLVVFCMLICIAFIDIYEMYIYDILVYIGFVACLDLYVYKYYITNAPSIVIQLVSVAITFLFYLILYFLSKKIYGEEVFGLGDVQLSVLIALIVSSDYLYYTIFLPFILAFAYVLIISVVKLIKKPKQEQNDNDEEKSRLFLPFAPFMCLSGFLLVTCTPFFDKITSLIM